MTEQFQMMSWWKLWSEVLLQYQKQLTGYHWQHWGSDSDQLQLVLKS